MPSYLGIDASLEGTGLCLVTPGGYVLQSTTVKVGKLRDMERLAHIKTVTTAFIARTQLSAPILHAAVEGYAFDAVNRAFALGEVGGMLRLILHEHRIPRVDVPPVNLKKWATGRHDAEKADMVAAAKAEGARLENADDHNQADAYFLSRVALAVAVDNPTARPRERSKLEVIHSLIHPAPKKARPRPRRLVKNPV